nr:MAG TPA: hypothetical protein [Caudoviricetes sp.]
MRSIKTPQNSTKYICYTKYFGYIIQVTVKAGIKACKVSK